MTLRARLMSWSFELDRAARLLAIVREELAFRLLTQDDWLELGRSLYGRSDKYSFGSQHNESGLFEFERVAIEQAFPPPPASILVGGCRGGRELFALLERGYRIDAAYDPVAAFIDAVRSDPRLADAKDRVCVGAHQGIESLAPIARLRKHGNRTDAVVVGWGSYTHIMGTKTRIEFLRSLRAVCPSGPVLVSFHVGADNEAPRPRRFRAKLRRILRTPEAMLEEGDELHRASGGVHYFSELGFRTEASKAGYRVQHWQKHDFSAGHAVLLPAPPSVGP